MTLRIGIDLGGSKIEAVALDEEDRELKRVRIATPQGDYRATIAAVVDLVAELERAAGRRGTVGLGTPGAISPATGLIKNANSTCLNGMPLDRDLEAALGRPIRMTNDANCLAASEAVDGAAAGLHVVFAIILGTGVGGGLAVDGAALVGRNAIAGEWGHNPLPQPADDERPGPPCYCGRHGCIEAFLSGPALAADHAARGGDPVDVPAIVARAAAGEAAARATLDAHLDRLARALAAVINLVDPDAIVVGGGLSHIARIYDEVPRLWARHVFSDRVDTPLIEAFHGDASGVRGAARLWAADQHLGVGSASK